jgi:glycosyltransferase involved in cell wall biosynthesis
VKAVYIPVGGSVPAVTSVQSPKPSATHTIAVFGITPGVHKIPEIADIAYVVRYVKNHVYQLRLVAVGGGTSEAAEELRAAFRDTAVDLAIHGVVSAEEVSRILSAADLLLFVRGGVSTQRSSAMAGIACGLPVVAYANSATGHPLTEAGIITVPHSDRDALAKAVVEVVTNSHLRHELHQRSVLAHQTYFSWDVIARRYLEEVICN